MICGTLKCCTCHTCGKMCIRTLSPKTGLMTSSLDNAEIWPDVLKIWEFDLSKVIFDADHDAIKISLIGTQSGWLQSVSQVRSRTALNRKLHENEASDCSHSDGNLFTIKKRVGIRYICSNCVIRTLFPKMDI